MADSKKRAAMLDDDDKRDFNPMDTAGEAPKPKRSRKKKQDDDDAPGDVEGEGVTVHGQALLAIIERLENVHENIAEYKSDEKDLYGEVKSLGYNVSTVRRIIKVRKQDKKKVEEQDIIFDVYMRAIGGY